MICTALRYPATHSLGLPVTMIGMHKTKSDEARLDLLSLIIWWLACSRRSDSGVRREVREREKTEDPLAVFFYSHLFALSPRSKRLEQAIWWHVFRSSIKQSVLTLDRRRPHSLIVGYCQLYNYLLLIIWMVHMQTYKQGITLLLISATR